MRRILFEQTDFNTLPNPPAGFQYIGFNGPTFSQKDNNGDTTQPGVKATEIVELTSSEAIDLLSGQGVVEGTRYLITGVDVDLYGGTDVLVNGLPNNQFSVNGYGRFYNPRNDLSVWNPTVASYSVDANVIYGGKVWKNLTGSIGSNDDIFTLDGTNWELQDDYTNTDHYITVWDQIEMGYSGLNYVINSRYDSFRNNYVRIGQLDSGGDRWFFCGVNPISAFGWGNDNINDCNIKDSYFNCLNIIGTTTIYGVEMSNYSYLFDCSFRDSQIEALIFNNESGSTGLSLNNSYFKNCKFENNSNINGNFNDYSTIEYLNLSNNSYMNSLTFYASYLGYLNLDNNSTITNISASSSNFQNVNMTNNSWISNIDLTISVANSTLQRVDISNRSYIQNVDLYDSTMYEIKLDNYSYIEGGSKFFTHIYLWNSSINYINFNNHSRMYGDIGLSSSYFKRIDMTNRSRIEGVVDFENSHLEKIDVTNDSLINNLYFTSNSYVENLEIVNSNFQSLTLDSSNFYNISLNGTYFANMGLSSSSSTSIKGFSSYISDINIVSSNFSNINVDRSQFSNLTSEDIDLHQLDLNTAYLNLGSLGTYSNTFPSGSSFRFNEFKYQFSLTFDGTVGYGLTDTILNIPTMLVPQDYYIEKIIIESSDLTYSGDPALFSFGFLGLSPSQIEAQVTDIGGKISVVDLSNGGLLGIKADSDITLSSYLTGGTDITSGGIKVEVTIKNTNNYYD
jgi:uncharacterized protein YjbI with pentapeptide repeats